ncbi:MAG: ribosome maturation factor RimM [Peptostreptococcaceae bacterium]|nr:ribosome maturation factor RimM [Peptostreptococcaceae bacterium]
MKKYRIGQMVNTHGLKGEMKIYSYTDYPERFKEIEYIYFEREDQKYYIEKVKFHKSMPIIKLKGIDIIEEAEKYRGKTLYIDEQNLRELDEDEYMISDLIGLEAFLNNGSILGTVVNVLQYSANDIYVIRSDSGKEFLVPAIKEFIPTIDIENKKMIIKPIEGLLE